ncbi:hypothetical protein [Phenylobacterium sp.]|jgi:hypothetical protein|uniref:hypothetical protein n=1 Tax=Phenylobacterium sp. TaxID=1871053 RepID=UPI002E337A02|nr:hypothetical protein [Phenylobacterium sp.]HEX2559089.1 hypothetical protein [Phenylobacterium sp.]
MLVYGERVRREAADAMLARIDALLADADAEPLWILRHEGLVAALIEAGRLAQGLADVAFAERGVDAPTPPADAAMALTRAIASQVMTSLSTLSSHTPGTGDPGSSDRAWESWVPALRSAAAGVTVEVKAPEGYAYYAVYPETYGLAAQQAGFDKPPAVLGLRSIGTSLAAIVGAAGSARSVVTARPCGHPFARELKLSNELIQRLKGDVAVVDEGPGMSGSSFGAAADLLEGLGVPPDRLWFFPSHLGDLGPRACERHRRRWAGARKRLVTFEDFALGRLPGWFEDLVGEALGPLEDLSGGAWRQALNVEAPVHAAQERRKYLLRTRTGEFLLKFSGLGATGSDKFARAQALHAAGFAPEPLALRHGFLLERWVGEARVSTDRDALMDVLGRYLAFRAGRFPAAPEDGAPPGELVEMAAYNAGQLLGEAAADAVRGRLTPLLSAPLRPVRIDGRMHAWEWLVLPDGRILKADALDHDDAHDLVGCQDIAWDVAGAWVELGLTREEAVRLCARAGADEALLQAFEIAYLAFQAGAWTFALAGAAAEERPPIGRLLDGYCNRLAQRL